MNQSVDAAILRCFVFPALDLYRFCFSVFGCVRVNFAFCLARRSHEEDGQWASCIFYIFLKDKELSGGSDKQHIP